MQLDSMSRLVACFRKLPGVGQKTATRYAYNIIEQDKGFAEEFCKAITNAKDNIKFCEICGNYTEKDTCAICENRDKTIICVVAQPKDVTSFEKIGNFNGVYHVLHGVIDYQKGITVNDIRIKELMARLSGVKEVIVATNPDISGELTASYLANQIKPLGIVVSRLAYGISVGSEIEYADEVTLQRALNDRKPL